LRDSWRVLPKSRRRHRRRPEYPDTQERFIFRLYHRFAGFRHSSYLAPASGFRSVRAGNHQVFIDRMDSSGEDWIEAMSHLDQKLVPAPFLPLLDFGKYRTRSD
jgi:hypothetical protein